MSSLQDGVAHHQAGRLAEAETAYRLILRDNPNDPDALHLLGILASQTGHLKEAIDLVRRAIALRPHSSDFRANLARLLADHGEITAAILEYRAVLEIRTADHQSWYALGVLLARVKQTTEAEAALNNAIRYNPAFAEAYVELGNLKRSQGEIVEALKLHKAALLLRNQSPNVHNAYGNTLVEHGEFEPALEQYKIAAQLAPSDALYHVNAASVLRRLHRDQDAVEEYQAALQLDAGNTLALTRLAALLIEQKHFIPAKQLLDQSLAITANLIETHQALGDYYLEIDDPKSAQPCFRRAIELNPDSVNAWIGLGAAHRSLGEFDQASAALREALRIDPDNVDAHKHLSSIGSIRSSEADILLAQTRQLDMTDEARSTTHFTLAKVLEDAGDYDSAFDHYKQGNKIAKAIGERDGKGFSRQLLDLLIEQQISIFNPEFLETGASRGNPSEQPVFVVGMPRSGTTLAEQIMASHPQVKGLGELEEISAIAKVLSSQKRGPDGQWDAELIRRETNNLLQQHSSKAPDALRTIDKMPANLMNLGLIQYLFPNARVVICRRDPRDTCLSCYFQMFVQNALPFAYDLEDCAYQYNQQQRIESHWLKTLSLRMLPLQYETLVNDLEGQSRRLIDFLGLEWDPRCLEFYKTQRSVKTASVWQVRQPIYASSVGRWKHYRKHLGPLFKALNLPDDD